MMKTFAFVPFFVLSSLTMALGQKPSTPAPKQTALSKVTVRVLDEETLKPVNAKFLIVNKNPNSPITPLFEDRDYRYKVSGNDTINFTIFASGYETLNASLPGVEINGTEVFYLKPKVNEPSTHTSKKESPILPDDITSILYFNQSNTVVSARSQLELAILMRFLSKHEIQSIEIDGHTDNVGDPHKNFELSMDRARLIKEYLMTNSVMPSRIQSKAYGSTKPAAPNDTERNKRCNRRVEIRLAVVR